MLTLVVSKYHKLSCSSSSLFFDTPHLFNHFQRPIPFHFHLLPIIKYIRASFSSPLPLFIPHSLLLSRRFLSNCPLPSLFSFPFFTPPFLLLVICRGEAASAASSSIRRQIPTFCQRSARSHFQGSNKIKKPVTCTPVESSRLREACLAPSCNRVAQKREKETCFQRRVLRVSAHLRSNSFEIRSWSWVKKKNMIDICKIWFIHLFFFFFFIGSKYRCFFE